MNLKNLLKPLMVAFMISITVPAISDPITNAKGPGKDANAAVQPMLNRLQEIKDMDKSSLSKTEKKELRNEVKGIKKEMKAAKNGVFLSVGAVIIIILLLILLL